MKTNYSRLRLKFLIGTLILFISAPVLYADKPDKLFQSEELLYLEIRADFKTILKDRDDEREYHDATLSYMNADGEKIELPTRLKVRGNFRRNPDNCKFPPLMLNFKKKEVDNSLFDKQNKLKLVTPCQFEDDVIEEYLTYKLYNELSDYSLRVRLAKILYYDSKKDKKVFEKYCFIIEDEGRAAKRLDAKITNKFLYPFDLDTAVTSTMAVFNYMIGNKDYYITSRHNIVLMQPKDTTLLPFPVAYDFDWAEFIDAGYTKPEGVPEELLENRRVYYSICYPEKVFEAVFDQFREERTAIEGRINELEVLKKYAKKTCLNYIDEFYEIINSKDKVKTEFLDVCRKKTHYIQVGQ